MKAIATVFSIMSLIGVASSSFALDQYTVSYESSWTMSADNTVTFTMHGFDLSLLDIEGGGKLLRISVTVYCNSLSGSFATDPDLGDDTGALMSLSTKNAANTSGFARESEPIYGLYGEEGEGFLYKFKSYDSNPEAFMAFSPDKIIYGNFVTDTTLQFTLTGTIPAADASNADYNMTGSGSAVILYTYYGIPAPVPEPSSAALALAGLAMLFTRRRRKVLS